LLKKEPEMAIKQIVAIIDLKGRRPAVELAADLAGRLGARLTGLAVRYDPVAPAYALGGVPGDFIVAAQANSEQAAKTSAEGFEEIARRSGASFETEIIDLGYGEVDGVVARARLSDLAVIGQDDPDEPEPMRTALLEALLFDTGVPVLVVPFAGVTEFKPGKALIAWDGSATAARAVRAALPLLALATQVEVLTVERGAAKGELGADIGTYLADHGLKVEIARMTPDRSLGVADALLNYITDNGFDWLVMGAYGHSRLREAVFGGPTHDILDEVTVPVLMAH
jgi:nucleotide-binding universal stress UspA family protein